MPLEAVKALCHDSGIVQLIPVHYGPGEERKCVGLNLWLHLGKLMFIASHGLELPCSWMILRRDLNLMVINPIQHAIHSK